MAFGKVGKELTRAEMQQLGVMDTEGKPIRQKATFQVDYELPELRELGEPNKEKRTVPLSFSSETPVSRWWGEEILDHKTGSVRTERLKDGIALIEDHDPSKRLGIVEGGRIVKGRGIGVARFSRSQFAEEAFQDVLDGIRKYTSVGYNIFGMILEEESKDGPDKYRVTDWEPLEVSDAYAGADHTVGFMREESAVGDGDGAKGGHPVKEERAMENPTVPTNDQTATATATPPAPPSVPTPPPAIDVVEVRDTERTRIRQIADIGKRWKMEELADNAIEAGTSLDDFRKLAMEEHDKRGTKIINPDAPGQPRRTLGLTQKEIDDFSIARMILAMADPDNRPLQEDATAELRACDAWGKEIGVSRKNGRMIPPEIFYRGAWLNARAGNNPLLEQTRATITTSTEGADLKPTIHDAANFIELLRAATPTTAAATILPGLTGDLLIPRRSAGTSASFVAEGSAVSQSEPTFDQVLLQPKTLGAYAKWSRKALLQFSPSLENLVRIDLLRAIAEKIEDVAIEGGGSNEPTGITGTSGIGSVAASGSGVYWEHPVKLETEVDTDDALMGKLMYLTTAAVVGQMKRTTIATGASDMIWDRTSPTTPVNGYPCMRTSKCPSDLGTNSNLSALIFGNFADLFIGVWDSIFVLVNPYESDTSGIVKVTVLHEVDVAVRHPESFAACLDILPTL